MGRHCVELPYGMGSPQSIEINVQNQAKYLKAVINKRLEINEKNCV